MQRRRVCLTGGVPALKAGIANPKRLPTSEKKMTRFVLLLFALLGVACSGPALVQMAGVEEGHSVSIDGVERTWRMFVPDQYEEGIALPLVLNLHGTGSTPDRQSQYSEFEILAAKEGFLVASPAGKFPRSRDGVPTWNVDLIQDGVDDVDFIKKLIATISSEYSVDPNRIYATGFSGGARMSSRLACELSESIAAIGAVGGIRYPEDCNPARPVPVIIFHGKRDRVNHYTHQVDSPDYWRMGVEDALGGWVTRNDCADNYREEVVSQTVSRLSYSGCEGGADIVFYRSEDGGHTWPGSAAARARQEKEPGTTESEIPATIWIWDFFESHPLG
ncbi:MAG: polyhydroxybutyrate depolymerase [Parasphingorhabdus sp.]|jgi:polyhydroxybutyrate depolymerase